LQNDAVPYSDAFFVTRSTVRKKKKKKKGRERKKGRKDSRPPIFQIRQSCRRLLLIIQPLAQEVRKGGRGGRGGRERKKNPTRLFFHRNIKKKKKEIGLRERNARSR